MKKIILLSLVLGLVGCASTVNFFDVQTTPVQNSGYWTGQYDRLVATLKLNSNGTGVICQDAMGTARIMSVKKSNDKLYSQDGTFWKVQNETSNSMKLNYAIGGGYEMKKDDNLSLVTLACLEKLK